MSATLPFIPRSYKRGHSYAIPHQGLKLYLLTLEELLYVPSGFCLRACSGLVVKVGKDHLSATTRHGLTLYGVREGDLDPSLTGKGAGVRP